MHRSGTSAMTGMLQQLGLYLGNNLLGITQANPKGHFEHLASVLLNDIILMELNSAWYSLQPLHLDWASSQGVDIISKIRVHLDYYFGAHSLFGLKDPRMCLLLFGYMAAAHQLGFTVKLIIMERNTEEIVASLVARDNMDPAYARALAEYYKRCIELYTSHQHRLKITFDDLVNKTELTILRIAHFLPELTIDKKRFDAARVFIDKNLKHHNLVQKI